MISKITGEVKDDFEKLFLQNQLIKQYKIELGKSESYITELEETIVSLKEEIYKLQTVDKLTKKEYLINKRIEFLTKENKSLVNKNNKLHKQNKELTNKYVLLLNKIEDNGNS